jgi:hypothetical protein
MNNPFNLTDLPKLETGPGFLPSIGERIVALLLFFAYPLAFIGLLYSAYLLIVSAGKPEGYNNAKKNITFIITGIFIIVFTTALINIVVSIFKK